MFLDLSKMRGTRERVERVYPASAFVEAGDEYAVAGPVDLWLDVQKDHDRYRLVGRARASLRLECSRCLEAFETAIDAPFDLVYLPQARNTGDGEIEVGADDLSTAFYRDDVIDLGQLLREQFYLALPMKPLCAAACRGLCPQCGANLNRTPCHCAPRWEDPRLAVLKGLLDRDRPD